MHKHHLHNMIFTATLFVPMVSIDIEVRLIQEKDDILCCDGFIASSVYALMVIVKRKIFIMKETYN